MASIVKFLPPETQKKVQQQERRFEKSFNLPEGTVEKVSGRGGGGGGGSSQGMSTDPAAAAQRAEEVQRAAEIQQQQQQQAAEQIRQQAEQQKRNELIATRAAREAQAQQQAIEMGILGGEGVIRAVRAREATEIERAGREAVARVRTTGTITRQQPAPPTQEIKVKQQQEPERQFSRGTKTITEEPRQEPKPLSIQPSTIKDFAPGYKQSFSESLKQSAGKIFSKKSFTQSQQEKELRVASVGSQGGTIRRESFYQKIIEPFKYTGKTEGEKESIRPRFGTVNVLDVKETRGEAEKRRVREELILKGSADTSMLSELYGETDVYKAAKNVPVAVETGALVAASLVPGANLPVSTYFIGTGIKKGLDLSQAKKEGSIITTREKIDVIGRLGFGVSGVVSETRAIEKALVDSEFARLASSKIMTKGTINVGDYASLQTLKAQQKSGRLVTNYELVGKVVKEGEKISFVPIGKGTATTKGVLATNIERDFSGGTKVLSVRNFDFGTKTFQIGKFKDYPVSLTRTTVTQREGLGFIYGKKEPPILELARIDRVISSTKENPLPLLLRKDVLTKQIKKGFTTGGETKTSYSVALSKRVGKGPEGEEFFFVKSGRVDLIKGEFKGLSDDIGLIKVKQRELGLTGLEKDGSDITKVVSDLPKESRTPMSSTFSEAPTITKPKTVVSKIDVKTFAEVKGPALTKTPSSIPTALEPKSTFAGQGLYEQSSVGGVNGIIRPTLRSEIKPMALTQLSTPTSTFETKGSILTKVKSTQKLYSNLAVSPAISSITIIKNKQGLGQASKQQQVYRQLYQQKQINRGLGSSSLTNVPRPRQPIGEGFIITPFFLKPIRIGKKKKKTFDVEVRRKGLFRRIGSARSLNEAINLGKERVEKTVAASFKVKGYSGESVPLPKNFYRKTTKSGLVLIEKKSRRIKARRSGSKEVSQLQRAKLSKKKKQKRRSTKKNE